MAGKIHKLKKHKSRKYYHTEFSFVVSLSEIGIWVEAGDSIEVFCNTRKIDCTKETLIEIAKMNLKNTSIESILEIIRQYPTLSKDASRFMITHQYKSAAQIKREKIV